MSKCPKCGEPIHAKVLAKLAKENEITLSMTLSEGHVLLAETLGSQILNMEKLLKSVAKHLGGKSHVFITGLKMEYPVVSMTFMVTDSTETPERLIDMIKSIKDGVRRREQEKAQ